MSQVEYEFRSGFKTIEKGKAEMIYIRRRGLQLAKELNTKVSELLYNDALYKWQDVGYCTPDEIYVDSWGNQCKLDADGHNFRPIK